MKKLMLIMACCLLAAACGQNKGGGGDGSGISGTIWESNSPGVDVTMEFRSTDKAVVTYQETGGQKQRFEDNYTYSPALGVISLTNSSSGEAVGSCLIDGESLHLMYDRDGAVTVNITLAKK